MVTTEWTLYFLLLGKGTAHSDLRQKGSTLAGRRTRQLKTRGGPIRLEGGLRTEQVKTIECQRKGLKLETTVPMTETSSSLREGPKKAGWLLRD